jgi:hypothetical protein
MQRAIEKGAVTIIGNDPNKGKDNTIPQQHIKQLEKALEKANVLLWGQTP